MEIRNLYKFINTTEKFDDKELLNLNYESPINLIASEMETKLEADCVSVVQRYGFDVNAEELAKALAYDRGQYDKGYAAARQKYERPHGKWKAGYNDCCGYLFCSNCGTSTNKPPYDYEYMFQPMPNFCQECGADMRGNEDE